jgi:hypothetical protein
MNSDGIKERAILDQARSELARATSLSQIKDIRAKAEAVRRRAQANALGLDIRNHAAEVKLRAERLAGKLLSQLMLRGGDRRSPTWHARLKLKDLGISRNQSTRWQIEARVPESIFCEYIEQTRDAGQELTAAQLMRIAKLLDQQETSRAQATTDRHEHANGKQVHGHLRVYAPSKINGHRRANESVNGQARMASCNGVNGHAPSKDLHNPNEEVSPVLAFAEIISDLENHHHVLTGIVTPICDSEEISLRPVERRMLRYLLSETRQLFDRLGTLQYQHSALKCQSHAQRRSSSRRGHDESLQPSGIMP